MLSNCDILFSSKKKKENWGGGVVFIKKEGACIIRMEDERFKVLYGGHSSTTTLSYTPLWTTPEC